MNAKTVATALGEIIVEDADFVETFDRLEKAVVFRFVGTLWTAPDGLFDAGDVNRLLRYSDVLSHSAEPRHREMSYRAIALLREFDEAAGFEYEVRERIVGVSEAILVQLGNFPGIKTLNKIAENSYALPLRREFIRIAKELLQVSKRGDAVLTDAQFEIVERMRGADYFSFSGPTSLGKSFILKDLIYEIAQRSDLDEHCVILLVPTKALIGQTAADLRRLLMDVPDVNIATFPTLPRFLRQRFKRTIFVFTPERLLRYLAHPVRDIDYLFVDEAQRVIAKNDTRSSLYYHSIIEATRRFATKLIFASPSIENPELFLELFQKSTAGALSVLERTVSQQRYYIDLVDDAAYYFPALSKDAILIPRSYKGSTALDVITELSGNRKSIVYVNGSAPAALNALALAKTLPAIHDDYVEDLIKYVQTYVHKDYFLAECLRKGVAFHHGKMPQEVRERVEAYFSNPDSKLQFVFCTSTLLEGVNLPAKNIFVLSDKYGGRNFSKIDFENLVGRAGRLTFDFSGNVVCIRNEPNRWAGGTRDLIPQAKPQLAKSFLVNPDPKKKKDYTDIARILRGQKLPTGASEDARRSAQQYASILMLHQLDQQATPLRSFFVDKVKDGQAILKRAISDLDLPIEVLRRSPDILPKYQSDTWAYLNSAADDKKLLNDDADFEDTVTFHRVLQKLAGLYGWRIEESQGRDPLLPKNATTESTDKRLWYWATLMKSWVRGDPLSRVIKSSINYYKERGQISYRDYSKEESLVIEAFDASSARHVNLIIEETLRDLEGGLRFRIIGYLQNYYELSALALGTQGAGINVATLVEYGTSDARAIELQEVGLSRNLATVLLSKYSGYLRFSISGELEHVDLDGLLLEDDFDDELRTELLNVLEKSPQPLG